MVQALRVRVIILFNVTTNRKVEIELMCVCT